MSNRERHVMNGTPAADPNLVAALGQMTIHFGMLEDMLKILQARAEGVDIEEFVLTCGLEKRTAFKILKELDKYYDPQIVRELNVLFKTRNEFKHSAYLADTNGDYLRLREGADVRDLQGDITQIHEATQQALAIIPRLAELQPMKPVSKEVKNITIRTADFTKDKATISTLMAELQTHEKTIRTQRDTWSNIEDNYLAYLNKTVIENNGICALAELNGNAIGMICGWIEDPDEPAMDINEPSYGYIGEGIVRSEYQRHGIYQKLVDKMETFFKDKGISVIRTTALNGNEGIAKFLAKNAFAPYYTCFEKRTTSN